jgi:IMP dehydrogenase/GMP reductase
MKATQQRLVSSVEASNIKDKYKNTAKVKVEKKLENKITSEGNETKLSIKKLKKKQDKKDINLNIQITPYSNRVIIPKI